MVFFEILCSYYNNIEKEIKINKYWSVNQNINVDRSSFTVNYF